MIKAGDACSCEELQWVNQAAMTPFPNLSNQDLNWFLAYTCAPAVKLQRFAVNEWVAQGGGGSSGISMK